MILKLKVIANSLVPDYSSELPGSTLQESFTPAIIELQDSDGEELTGAQAIGTAVQIVVTPTETDRMLSIQKLHRLYMILQNEL